MENSENKIVLKQSKPKGIYNAMNEWIKIAKWEYIIFLHSDDFLEKNTLNNYLDFIKETWNKDFYYAIRNNYYDEKKQIIWNMPNKSIYKKGLTDWLLWFICYIMQPAVISKRELHNKYWLYNENYKIVSDWEFFIKLAKNNVEGIFYNKVVTNFRIHENSASTGNIIWNDISVKEEYDIIDKYYNKYWFIYKLVKSTYRKLFY
jgi:glycosyltransferase involved in cell wall biosynthesis